MGNLLWYVSSPSSDRLLSAERLFCFAALGPQARFIYRYGSFNDCKDKLEDFKFCLTMRGITAEERRDRWLQRKSEKTAAKRLTSSSEDVWEMRREPLVDPAFVEAQQQQPKT